MRGPAQTPRCAGGSFETTLAPPREPVVDPRRGDRRSLVWEGGAFAALPDRNRSGSRRIPWHRPAGEALAPPRISSGPSAPRPAPKVRLRIPDRERAPPGSAPPRPGASLARRGTEDLRAA